MNPVFYGRLALLGCVLSLAAAPPLPAQEPSLEELPGLKERAVVMHIVSRIVERNQQVVWNAENAKVTIPGRPVGLKLVGSNLVVAVQFTPFFRKGNHYVLVAQGQIWINVPDEGMRYHTTMQTIPLETGEQVYFFPLGSLESQDGAGIEIQLLLEPYSEGASSMNAGSTGHGGDLNPP